MVGGFNIDLSLKQFSRSVTADDDRYLLFVITLLNKNTLNYCRPFLYIIFIVKRKQFFAMFMIFQRSVLFFVSVLNINI